MAKIHRYAPDSYTACGRRLEAVSWIRRHEDKVTCLACKKRKRTVDDVEVTWQNEEDEYGCLQCGWVVPLVDGKIPTICFDCGDPREEAL